MLRQMAVMVLGIGLSLTACSNKQAEGNAAVASASAAAAAPATYTAIVDADYPPYGMLDEAGKATGFDVEILSTIARDQGFNIEFKPASWQILLHSLDKKEYQIAMGAIWAPDIDNETHVKNYSFSSPYAYSVDAIGTLPSVTHIQSFEDLKKHRVSTLKDASYVDDLIELKGAKAGSQDILAEKTSFLAFQKMLKQEANATLIDAGVLHYFKKNNPELDFSIHQEGDYFSEPYELVYLINRDNPELNQKIQLGLQHIVQTGEYQNIYKKWFGVEPQTLPKQL